MGYFKKKASGPKNGHRGRGRGLHPRGPAPLKKYTRPPPRRAMDAHKGGGEGRAGFYYLGWGGVGGASARRVARSAWWFRISSIKPLARPSLIRAGHSPSWDVIKGLPGGLPAPANPGTPGLRLRGNVGCPPPIPPFFPPPPSWRSPAASARPAPAGYGWVGGGIYFPPGRGLGKAVYHIPPLKN